MNDYLSSIDNLDEDKTNPELAVQSKIKVTPVVEKSNEMPKITSVDENEFPESIMEDIAQYMQPSKVLVRKYRLKK